MYLKKIYQITLLLLPAGLLAQQNLLLNKQWRVKEMLTVFKNDTSWLYSKDSAVNLYDMAPVNYRFAADSSYGKFRDAVLFHTGRCELQTPADTAVIDAVRYKIIQLADSDFVTRGFALQQGDAAGNLDTAYTYIKLYVPAAGVIPVRLSSLNGYFTGNAVELRWLAAAELNTAYYEVWTSTDGRQFSYAGSEQARGTASGPADYRFVHSRYTAGVVNYYKLRMVDADGKAAFSPVAAVRTASRNIPVLSVHPNPAADYLTLFLKQPYTEVLVLRLYNTGGQPVLSHRLPAAQQWSRIALPALPAGTYTLQLFTTGGRLLDTQPLSIQR